MRKPSGNGSKPSLTDRLRHAYRLLKQYVLQRFRARRISRKLAQHAHPLSIRRELVRELFEELRGENDGGSISNAKAGGEGVFEAETAAEPGAGAEGEASPGVGPEAGVSEDAGAGVSANAGAGASTSASAGNSAGYAELTDQDRALVHRIRHETEIANRNNVTRTEAYRAVYHRSPELQWALLAHLVSRNGGWNMTDLQGDLLPVLLDEETRTHFFVLLERINALIFHDAYPQLLLYEASRREGRDLSYLLPSFGVSRFMLPAWTQFWQRRDSVMLTTALIVNEQHVIEQPLVQSDYFKLHVLRRATFLMQMPLQTNTVVFPYGSPLDEGGEMLLAGLILENFSNLTERIEFGKQLYAILIGIPEVFDGVMAFVRGVHHSGSRADYAPHLFAMKRDTVPSTGEKYRERLEGCALLDRNKKLYSPTLADAWADVPLSIPERVDWLDHFTDAEAHFAELRLPRLFEITFEHCMAINKLELAVQQLQRFGLK